MPRVRVPIRRSGIRYTARPGRIAVKPKGRGLLGGLAGLLLCLLCLATLGLLGIFATFIAVTAYLGSVWSALKTAGGDASAHYVNMSILVAALGFAGYYKIRRSL